MKVTLNFLKSNHAGKEEINWFVSQQDDDLEIIIHKLIEEGKFQWANWLISRILNKEKLVKYAIFSAELVLDLCKEKYQNDKPRSTLEVAKKYSINLSADYAAAAAIVTAAQAAVSDADTAVYDAISTTNYPTAVAIATAAYVRAAAAATYATATTTATYAASYAAVAVDDAVNAAVYDAMSHNGDASIARRDMYIRILNYGISLIEKE